MNIYNLIKTKKIVRYIVGYMGLYHPVFLTKMRYRMLFHKKLDLKNPKNLNEKISWLNLYSDTSLWINLSDKYKVREYVKSCGLENLLVKLYGVWDNANEIDFEKLPYSFVLKTNNGCGTVILVKEKSKLDVDMTRKRLNKWLKMKINAETAELHYLRISPCIIAEELLVESKSELSTSVIDYKLWCFDGEPYIFVICSDRTENKVKFTIYDTSWNLRQDMLDGRHKNDKPIIIPKPQSFDKMIAAARVLSKLFPQVRVDFYEINGKPFFGELTFTSLGGMMDYFTPECLLEMGNKITLSSKQKSI